MRPVRSLYRSSFNCAACAAAATSAPPIMRMAAALFFALPGATDVRVAASFADSVLFSASASARDLLAWDSFFCRADISSSCSSDRDFVIRASFLCRSDISSSCASNLLFSDLASLTCALWAPVSALRVEVVWDSFSCKSDISSSCASTLFLKVFASLMCEFCAATSAFSVAMSPFETNHVRRVYPIISRKLTLLALLSLLLELVKRTLRLFYTNFTKIAIFSV